MSYCYIESFLTYIFAICFSWLLVIIQIVVFFIYAYTHTYIYIYVCVCVHVIEHVKMAGRLY